MSKSVFISRHLEVEDQLRIELHHQGFEVIDASMIALKAVMYAQPIPKTDWIFFSSKNAAQFFFSQKPLLGNQRLAAIGDATSRELIKFGDCEFIGSSNDLASVANEFLTAVGHESVLFPQADRSLRTIQRALPLSQVTDLICYETVRDPKPVGFPDVLVFTSPSNIQSFLTVNQIKAFQKVIAFGKSSQRCLNENGIEHAIIPESLQVKDVVHAITEASIS